MAVGKLRNAKVIINQRAIYDNLANTKSHLEAGTDLFVVVKADGYGHGAIQVARIAEKAGASGFCVALLDEALDLRQAGFNEPILVLGITDPQFVTIARDNQISLTVSSTEWLKTAADFLTQVPSSAKLNVHLALDTGMGRIGFQTAEELKAAVQVLNDFTAVINFEGIFTHFATADSKNSDYFNYQYDNFNKLMAVLDKRPRYVHVANSATSLWHKVCGGNMIRFGIGTYGLNPSGTEIPDLPYELHPAMSVVASLIYVKLVKKGKSISYGATYTTSADEWIGTIPLGYADGIPRKLQGFSVLVDGNWCPIVGRVCMDQFMIKLPKRYAYGTPVTILGKSKDKTITADDLAQYLGTINYEVICGFSPRLRRKYE
ncbi:alanine racemase [Lentilactobacillus kisonensis]|uniref:Alanine racemase n=2 Tax=Lentilactobacillus kisonensis TaxID=481722 RepID=H1LIN1_9LACO|nr:alanine racemase [Lentilactobacillus kisonensis]EHO49599.1 alanine racemase [Lentilactobacillus kisonensis F0435]KRL20288.1 alanine racemase [Lentilactobacillus kisonensis DSM 19906 = JCM 15041]